MGRTNIRIHDLRHAGQVLAAQSGATLADLMARLVKGDRTEELMDSLLLYCFSGEYLRDNPGVIDKFRSAPVPDLTGFGAMTVACATHDTVDRLGDIDIPTLVVIGTRDILIRPELSKRLTAGIPGAAMVEINEAHMKIWEQPEPGSLPCPAGPRHRRRARSLNDLIGRCPA